MCHSDIVIENQNEQNIDRQKRRKSFFRIDINTSREEEKMMDDNATYRQEIFLFVEQTITRV